MKGLALEGVVKSFPGVRALDGVSFAVAPGEVHALVGENGAGKSTLMRILGGACVPDAGTLRLDGVPLPVGEPLAVARRGVSIIYQELALVPGLTAAENVFLGRELGAPLLARRRMNALAQRALDELGADVSATARVATLSVAKRQLVEIARAVHAASKVLVLDEPTSSLPDADVRRLLAIVKGLRDRGLSIVYISHRLDEVFALADRVTVLRDGRVTGSAPAGELDRRALIRLMVGRDLEEEYPSRPARAGGEVVLEARGLRAPGRLHGVELTVARGEIVGLAGHVGAGRTSTGLALAGALRAEGTIRLAGREVRFRSPSDALAAGVAYVTEDRRRDGVFPALGVGPNVTMTSLGRFVRAGLVRAALERAAAARAVEAFDVRCAGLSQPAGTLSGGNQQKALLARCLLEPRALLILDEPTRGIDVGAKAEIYALMNRLTAAGLSIVLISSELPELVGMADRIVVLREGRSVGELARGEATEERVMALATRGAAA